MEPMDKYGIVSYVGRTLFNERVYYLKHHGYFKLPAGIFVLVGRGAIRLNGTRKDIPYNSTGEFIGVLTTALYRLWLNDELRTTASKVPMTRIYIAKNGIVSSAVTVIDPTRGKTSYFGITRQKLPNESLKTFAKKFHELKNEVVATWREHFITTPTAVLDFKKENPLEQTFVNPWSKFEVKTGTNNSLVTQVGKTKYGRPIVKLGNYGYFIVPKCMTFWPVKSNAVRVQVCMGQSGAKSSHLNFDTCDDLMAGLRNMLDIILKENGALMYHTARTILGSVFNWKGQYQYKAIKPIKLRDDGVCYHYSKTREPLLERREADRQWIKDHLETTDIERALTLYKEIPKDPM